MELVAAAPAVRTGWALGWVTGEGGFAAADGVFGRRLPAAGASHPAPPSSSSSAPASATSQSPHGYVLGSSEAFALAGGLLWAKAGQSIAGFGRNTGGIAAASKLRQHGAMLLLGGQAGDHNDPGAGTGNEKAGVGVTSLHDAYNAIVKSSGVNSDRLQLEDRLQQEISSEGDVADQGANASPWSFEREAALAFASAAQVAGVAAPHGDFMPQ